MVSLRLAAIIIVVVLFRAPVATVVANDSGNDRAPHTEAVTIARGDSATGVSYDYVVDVSGGTPRSMGITLSVMPPDNGPSFLDRVAQAFFAAARSAPRSVLGERITEEILNSFAGAPQAAGRYTPAGNGFIGGTTWIFGFNVPPGSEHVREVEERLLAKAIGLAGLSDAEKQSFVNTESYNFLLGVAMAHSISQDLAERVLADEYALGSFSAQHREIYSALRGRQFERLDCHSNGAMICLFALMRGDIKARRVRLFGPQITSKSLRYWQLLIARGL